MYTKPYIFGALLTLAATHPEAGPYVAAILRVWDTTSSDVDKRNLEKEINKKIEDLRQEQRLIAQDVFFEMIQILDERRIIPENDFLNLKACMLILEAININSKEGMSRDPQLSIEQLKELLAGPLEGSDLTLVIRTSTYELEEEGLIWRDRSINGLVEFDGIDRIAPRDELFYLTDHLFQSWDPKIDAEAIILECLKTNEPTVGVPEIDRQFSFGPRRLNAALGYLYFNNLIRQDNEFGYACPTGYALSYFRLSDKARLAAQRKRAV